MMAWPHEATDWADMLEEVSACYVAMAKAISEDNGLLIVAPDINDVITYIPAGREVMLVSAETNDTWTRDYGPITVEVDGRYRLLDYRFNGWGLKFASDRDNLVNTRMLKSGCFTVPMENRRMMVLEGGSIESDGKGTLLTTSRCLLSPNRNSPLTRRQIETRLKQQLGVQRVLWLDHGALEGDDTDSHVDTLARLAPNDVILYVKCDDKNDSHYEELRAMEEELKQMRTLDGKPYQLIALPLPDPIYHDGERLPATYANFLVTPHSVIMPVYGQKENDRYAAGAIATAFPGRKLLKVDCRALIRQHGSLHCATMQIPTECIDIS